MSRDMGRQEQIAITFSVPSQENEYFQARLASASAASVVSGTANTGGSSSVGGNLTPSVGADLTKRRKRSESLDEDSDEEEEEDDNDGEYLPDHENRQHGQHAVSHTNQRSHAATSNYGHHGQPQLQRRSPAEPFELSIPPHDPSSSTSGLTVPSMSTSGPSGSQGNGASGSATITDLQSGTGSTGTSPNAAAGTKKNKPVLGPDGLPPPKKKRRRQALSCTECKRRKIRCDRIQPCAPCTRRGEADKCKWNILEPVEKFVTRREYDEIKDSLNRLETILTTTTGSPGATEEVAAAVNMVKSKAVLLSKVMSVPQNGPHPHASHGSVSSLNPHASLTANITDITNPTNLGAVGGAIGNTVSLTPNQSLNLGMGLQNANHANPNSNSGAMGPHSISLSSNVKGLNDLDSPAASAAAAARVSMLVGTGSAVAGVPNAANLAATASGGGGTNATFTFSPFNLNVPSQSHPPHPGHGLGHGHAHGHGHGHGHGRGHLSPQSDEEFYRTNRAGSVSHSSSNSFSRSQSHMPNSFPTASAQPATSPHYGHFSSGITTDPISGQTYGTSATGQHQRPPSIDMGGFVVEDQSGSAGAGAGVMLRPESASSLSTLATVANASAMQNLHSMRRADGRSPTLTLPPLGSNTQTSHTHHSPSHSQSLLQSQSQLQSQYSQSQNIPLISTTTVPTIPNTGITGISAISNISPMITPTSLPMDSKAVREAELRRVMQGCLPLKEISDRLVDFYFDKVEWSISLLHRPTFMRTYQAFWFAPEEERFKISAPNSPSVSRTNGHVNGNGNTSIQDDGLSPAWIALFASLLCVSLERMGAYDAKTIGISSDIENYKSQCRRLYDASQAALILGDFIRYRSIESIQTLILYLHCQQTVGVTSWETHLNGTLALAIRLAIMTGLNKLSPEKPGVNPGPGLLMRELGRRAWWNLVERDWTSAARVGYTYMINPLQNFSDFPANLEWEEMEYGRPFFVRSRDIWTTVSSFTTRLELARLNRELTDQYNTLEGVSYPVILQYSDRMNEIVDQSPSVLLQPDDEFESANELARWDRLGFTFYFHSNVIKLHRPYFVTALLSSRSQRQNSMSSNSGASTSTRSIYSESISNCIRSAEAILDNMEESKASGYPGLQFWDTTTQCFAAAVVLIIDRWYSMYPKPDDSIDKEDAEERRRKIVAAIALMKDQAESIGHFCPAAAALDGLLDATTSTRRRSKKNARRGMDLNDVVNPINVSYRTPDLPLFVKTWIESQTADDSSSPSSTTSSVITTATTLSTSGSLPGMPLVADTSPDSMFWSRLFDAEFTTCGDMNSLFFPTIEVEPDSPMAGVIQDQSQGEQDPGSQQYVTQPGNGIASDGLGASAVWSAMSGPIGSMTGGDNWARTTPYESAARDGM